MGNIKDISTKRFGKLTVLQYVGSYPNGSGNKYAHWLCRCDCGKEAVKSGVFLRSGGTRSCGCLLVESHNQRAAKNGDELPASVKDMKGIRFGRLSVLGFAGCAPERGKDKSKCARWLCRCDCGKEVIKFGTRLRSKRDPVKSCGCISTENAKLIQPLAARSRIKTAGHAALASILSNYKTSAARRGLKFDLNFIVFSQLISSPCYYCNQEPGCKIVDDCPRDVSIGKKLYHGLDRVNNLLGYTPENVVPCCKVCNFAKGTMSVDEFYAWVLRVYKHQHNKACSK